ncbi:Hpt domain-containing protein [Alteromonas sp. A079]|uniref:Hpt domain-containing protein n=1 Tax=Alteromonas sp. A079 TaxID=3410268 RepID=UPI003BA0D07D
MEHVPTTSRPTLWNRDAALARLGNNAALLEKIVAMFLEQITNKLSSLQEAVNANDADNIRFVSHAIKGISGDVGAEALHYEASYLEDRARSGNIDNIDVEFKSLITTVNNTITAMKA